MTETLKEVFSASGHYLNIDAVILITIAFFLMYTAYWTCQSIAPKIMSDLGYGSIGLVNLFVIYFTFAVTSFIAVPLIKKVGYKNSMVGASFMYALWAFGFVLPAYKYENAHLLDGSGIFSDAGIISISLMTAFLTGLGAGPLWVGATTYISDCASNDNKGLFNSIFFGIF